MGDRRVIDALAARQHGVFNVRQLREAGYDKSAARRRVHSGEWIQLDHSVYCLGSAPASWERKMAAAVLSRREALVGGRSAAYLHGLRGFRPGKPVIVIPNGSNARSELARIVQAKRFDEIAKVSVGSFDVTSVAETIVCLGRDLPASRLDSVVDDALLSHKLALEEFELIFTREVESRTRGLGVLRLMVDERAPAAPSQDSSYLEGMLEMVLGKGDLPYWTREHPFTLGGAPSRVDVYFASWTLVVEADGRNWHVRMADFEVDRLRDNELATHGIQVLRFTYDMLKSDPDGCLDTIIRVGSLRNASGVA